jgi:hypothetical protein
MARSRNLVAEAGAVWCRVEMLREASRTAVPQICVSHTTTALHARPAAMMASASCVCVRIATASAWRCVADSMGVWPARTTAVQGWGCPLANPERRRRLGRTGVANLNCAPAFAFPVAPALLPQHIAMHPSALPAGTCFCLARCVPSSHQLLHRPAPGTQIGLTTIRH